MIQRQKRQTYARALTILGFEINELVNILGVSSSTIKKYLKETEGITYSDLDEFIYQEDVFLHFSNKEKEILNFIQKAKEKCKELSKESKRTDAISKGKGFMGWIHKNILKDCDKYDKKNAEINKELKELSLKLKSEVKKLKDPALCPHFSKVQFEIGITVSEAKE